MIQLSLDLFWKIWWRKIKPEIEGDGWLWSSNAFSVNCFFRNKETFLLRERLFLFLTNLYLSSRCSWVIPLWKPSLRAKSPFGGSREKSSMSPSRGGGGGGTPDFKWRTWSKWEQKSKPQKTSLDGKLTQENPMPTRLASCNSPASNFVARFAWYKWTACTQAIKITPWYQMCHWSSRLSLMSQSCNHPTSLEHAGYCAQHTEPRKAPMHHQPPKWSCLAPLDGWR